MNKAKRMIRGGSGRCVDASYGLADTHKSPRRVVYGVTVGLSAFALLRGQLRWMSSQGWDVKLVTTPDEDASAAASRENVEHYPLPMSRRISPIGDCVSLWRWLQILSRTKPFAVNVSTPKAGLLGGIAAWIKKIPRRVYVVRGLRLEGVTGPLAAILWVSEWLAMKAATDVIYVSKSLAREANARRLLDPRKSWVIGAGSSNGVNVQAIEDRILTVNPVDLRQSLGLSNQHFVVGFVGRIAKDKGLDTLIRAFSDMSLSDKTRLLCIGLSEDQELSEMLERLGEKAIILPKTNDVWGLLPAMDVLCLPTLREGFPNVVLEAAAAGIPTITTRATGAIDSVIDEQTGFLIDVGDHDDLVVKINRLVAHPDMVARLGSAANRRVVDEFKQEKIWQGVAEILSGQTSISHAIRAIDAITNGASK